MARRFGCSQRAFLSSVLAVTWVSGLMASELPVFPRLDLSGRPRGKVVRVLDGRSFEAETEAGVEKVALLGVQSAGASEGSKEANAITGKAFLRNLLKGEEVYILDEAEKPRRDKEGRRLAQVFRAPDGLFVNAEVIRQGYARAAAKDACVFSQQFAKLEGFAKGAEKGVWAKPEARKSRASSAGKGGASEGEEPVEATVTKETEEGEEDADDAGRVYVTRTGTKYHRGNCRHLSKSRKPISLRNAKARGYKPCRVCKPPE